MSEFDVLGTVGKLALPILQGSGYAGIRAWACEIWSREQRPPECFWSVGGRFSDRDFGQSGEKLGDPRVPRCACACLLSNAPGLADQLVVSQKDSARKRGNVGGTVMKISARPYFIDLFSLTW